jgi:hypothetical protein
MIGITQLLARLSYFLWPHPASVIPDKTNPKLEFSIVSPLKLSLNGECEL